MGFNLGAFAGGMAQAGMQTYQMMEAIESQKKRDELIQQQLDEAKAMKEAGAATYGRVGQEAPTGNYTAEAGIGANQTAALQERAGTDDFAKEIAKSEVATMRENAQRQGAALPEVPKYTKEQAAADYAQRMYAINPEKAQALERGGLELKSMQRSVKFDEDFDKERQAWQQKTADLHSGMTDAFAKDGANGVVAAYGKQLKDMTGQDVAVKGDQVVLSKGGKTVDSFNVKELPAKMEDALKNYYTHDFAEHLVSKGMFKNSTDAINYWQKKQEIDISRDKNAIAREELAAKKPVYAAQANFYNAGGSRGAGGGGGAAGKAAQAQALVDSGAAKDIEAAYRIMAAKDSRSAIDQDWAKIEAKHEENQLSGPEIAARKAQFYSRNGFAPEAIVTNFANGVDASGNKLKPADAPALVSSFNKRYPNSPIDISDLKWAAPKSEAKPETKPEPKPEAKPSAKAEEKPAEKEKPKSALPSNNFYSPENIARRKAEREARDAAEVEAQRKEAERKRLFDLEVQSQLRAGLPTH